MTKEETVLWNLADSYLAKSGYSVVGIEPSPDDRIYILKIKPFGSSVPPRSVTVFSDWLQQTVADNQLVSEITRNLDDATGQ